MGSVAIDIKKREREFEQLTLSDEHVVKYLILYRSKVDVSYGANTNIEITQAGDTFDFNQEIITLYASLDKTIQRCKFKDKQLKLLELIFEGHTLQDICKLDIGFKSSATYDMFDRLVKRIVDMNNELWYYTTGKNGYLLKKEERRFC
ncbi:transcriptional regulator [Bacillus phage vB_BanS-Thrax4]|nr:transcriptional regulator [Bacillus phage vB_BanS-Thrax4]